jgi:hypothetical protein
MLLIASFVGKLIAAGAELIANQVVRLVKRRSRDTLPSVDVTVTEPPVPLTYKDVEHQRAQAAASVAASKAAEAEKRNATTVGPPKAGKLPKN